MVLSPAFPQDESDSVWVPSKQLFVKKMKEHFPGLHIVVLSFNYPHHTGTYTWHGVEVTSFNGMYNRKINRLLLWCRVWRKLKKIHRQQHIIGIFSFWCGECALVGRHFARRHRLRHYCWISGMDAWKNNKLVKLIRPSAKELVAMSGFLVKEFEKNHGIRPARVIQIGIDPSAFPRANPVRDIDLIGVGSLSPFKHYDQFIRIVKEISKVIPDVKAVICGGGSERAALEELIEKLNMGKTITLLGYRPHEETLQWMQRSKILLHTSSYEGFGAVFLEALYAGSRVISFCYPLEKAVPHWDIVKNTDEMTATALSILQDGETDHSPVLVNRMDDTAHAIMKLFEAET